MFNKNKTIIMGTSGSGKSYKAIELALKNKGTTIIVNGCCGMDKYTDAFPELSDFISKEGNRSFNVEHNTKYFIGDNPSTGSATSFANAIIFGCGYGTLKKDKNSMIIYDDGSWLRQDRPILRLWQLGHTNCQIVIVVDSWADLLNIKESEITKDIKNDVCKLWNVFHLEKY